MTKRPLLAVGAVLLMTCLSALASASPSPDGTGLPNSKDAKPKAKALIQKVVRVSLYDDLSYPARIESRVNTTILAESDGYVSKLFAPLGTVIRPQEHLLEIRHTDPVYQYAPVIVRSPVRGVVSQVDVNLRVQERPEHLASTEVSPTEI